MLKFIQQPNALFWKQVPEKTGVYYFLNSEKQPIYIGKALNIRDRLKQHVSNTDDPKERAIVGHTAYLQWQETLSEFEALVLEANLVWSIQPMYNSELKDDKSPIYLVITDEKFGKVRLARKSNLTGKERLVFGPLTSAKVARQILRMLRHIYPFCTELKITRKPCFYQHLGLCDPCPNQIMSLVTGRESGVMSHESEVEVKKLTIKYQTNIRNLMKILQGDGRKLLKEITKEMQSESDAENFEEARLLRDRIYYLERLFRGEMYTQEELIDPAFMQDERKKETEELECVLGINTIHRVECYDISNLNFDAATASMVVFHDGDPDKKEYRRFKIKGKRRFDPEMLLEVLRRRFKHTEWKMPDLLVLDGGTPQVLSVYPALKAEYPQMPPLIGIAKGPDRLLVAKSLTYLNLPYDSHALHYIQRLRDEAHRFAKKYHLLLRGRNYGFPSGVKK
ncbi:MAG: GIY-YIG nuclease family protein [Patescibacteria group bacterium]|jgi:excinuclease ABC subunit C